ncbi:MAG: PilZ domain-containing protein [Acidobacteria bacterium]|nr:PilZ domain-containing protein [Acidobacteriota bacterium]
MGEAMLDCAVCSTRRWQSFEAAGGEDLRMAGATRLHCDICEHDTYWLPAQHDRRGTGDRRKQPEPPLRTLSATAPPAGLGSIAVAPPPDQAFLAKEAVRIYQTERRGREDRRGTIQRNHHRVPLRLPIRVRVSTLNIRFEEQTNTVNVCRTGVFFQSANPYAKGLMAFVTLNYSPLDPSSSLEKAGTVVRVVPAVAPGMNGVAIEIR